MREFDVDEIKNIKALLAENEKSVDIKLDEKQFNATHELLRKHFKAYLTPSVVFHSEKSPKSCYLCLKLDQENDSIVPTVEKILYRGGFKFV